MKIRWQKISAGVYVSDSGRWRVQKGTNATVARSNIHWAVFDNGEEILWASSLREAKQLVDDELDSESCDHEFISWHGSRGECQKCGTTITNQVIRDD